MPCGVLGITAVPDDLASRSSALASPAIPYLGIVAPVSTPSRKRPSTSRRRFLQISASSSQHPRSPASALPSHRTIPRVRCAGDRSGASGPTGILARIIGQISRKARPAGRDRKPAGTDGNLGTRRSRTPPPHGHTLVGIGRSRDQRHVLPEAAVRLPARHRASRRNGAGAQRAEGARPSIPANTVAEYIAYPRANPGKVGYASPGNGTAAHLAAELFKSMTGHGSRRALSRHQYGLAELLTGQMQLFHVAGRIAAIGAGRQAPRTGSDDGVAVRHPANVPRLPRPCRARR